MIYAGTDSLIRWSISLIIGNESALRGSITLLERSIFFAFAGFLGIEDFGVEGISFFLAGRGRAGFFFTAGMI